MGTTSRRNVSFASRSRRAYTLVDARGRKYLTDAAIALLERLTAQLFTRSSRMRDQSWSTNKTQVGRLIRLFGGAIDAMVRAREQDRGLFDVIDEAIGWDRMLSSRDEIATLGDLATEDPLALAAGRYPPYHCCTSRSLNCCSASS